MATHTFFPSRCSSVHIFPRGLFWSEFYTPLFKWERTLYSSKSGTEDAPILPSFHSSSSSFLSSFSKDDENERRNISIFPPTSRSSLISQSGHRKLFFHPSSLHSFFLFWPEKEGSIDKGVHFRATRTTAKERERERERVFNPKKTSF